MEYNSLRVHKNRETTVVVVSVVNETEMYSNDNLNQNVFQEAMGCAKKKNMTTISIVSEFEEHVNKRNSSFKHKRG